MGVPLSFLDAGGEDLQLLLASLARLRRELDAGGIEVQTTRLTVPPVEAGESFRRAAARVQDAVPRTGGGVDYYCLPLRDLHLKAVPGVADSLAADSRLFTNVETVSRAGLDEAAITSSAALMRALADHDPFTNLQFCASAAVPAQVPFFPAAAHDPSAPPTISVALESADLAVHVAEEARAGAPPFDAWYTSEYTAFLERAARLIATFPATTTGTWDFAGFDTCPAPFPAQAKSIGRALELLGGAPVGTMATLPSVARVTRLLGSLPRRGPGFHGVMLPVLEDAVLATRAAEGLLTIDKLLLYATVCGTGLDTVPLPGAITPAALAALVRNVSVLAARHQKPLTARLMPVPGLTVGDPVEFDFEYFAPSAVMDPR